ncbi:MAG TPA: phosphatase PAP2 family protein [Actinomycetota bacterium]|jgi:undecaprenyl-diphosphatase
MTERRARDVVGLVVGVSGLIATGIRSRSGPGETEQRIFYAAHRLLPQSVYPLAWWPMQYGTFGAVPGLAFVALSRRHARLAAAIAIGGTSAWIGAKGVKLIVGRERPHRILGGVRIRGKEEAGLGFPSGHAAVSASITTASVPYLGTLSGAASMAMAGYVCWARMYVGTHLPLDVAGGAALGVAVGSLANLILGVEPP